MAILNDLIVKGRSNFIGGLSGNLTGKVNGYDLNKNVPSDAVFTDTISSILYGEISATNASITTTNKNIHVIKFNYNVSDNENLTINNTQYPIYYNGNAITSGIINNGDIAMFIQDDTNQCYNLIFINKSNT